MAMYLPQSPAEFAGNAKQSETSYRRVRPHNQPVSDIKQLEGETEFVFNATSGKWMDPRKSYLSATVELTDQAGAALTSDSGIALAMGAFPHLFQKVEFKIMDTVVSSQQQYLPQTEALAVRQCRSRAWFDSQGKNNQWMPSLADRVNYIAADGKDSDSPDDILNIAALGLDSADTIELQASGDAVFASGADVQDVFQVGDKVELKGGAVYTVQSITDATTIVINNTSVVGAVAIGANFKVARPAKALRSKKFTIEWTPKSLSALDIGHALTSGKFSLALTGANSSMIQERMIEAYSSGITGNYGTTGAPTGGSSFKFNVTSLEWYVHVTDGQRVDNAQYMIDLDEVQCIGQKYLGATNTSTSNDFTVKPSTYAVTVAYQSDVADTVNNTDLSVSKFVGADGEEKSLTELYVEYAGQRKPAHEIKQAFGAETNYMGRMYRESMMNVGAFRDAAGCETLQEWQARGAYYHFPWPRDRNDKSTHLAVHSKFTEDASGLRVLLFQHYRRMATVTIQNGMTVEVKVEDA